MDVDITVQKEKSSMVLLITSHSEKDTISPCGAINNRVDTLNLLLQSAFASI